MQVRTYDSPYGAGRNNNNTNYHRNTGERNNYVSGYHTERRSSHHRSYDKCNEGDRALIENVNRAMSHSTASPGDVCLVDFGDDTAHCRTIGRRPAICISSMEYNEDSPILRVVPMTRQLKAVDMPYHVFIDKDRCDGLEKSGMAMGEQTIPITRDQIIRVIATVNDKTLMAAVIKAANAINMSYEL